MTNEERDLITGLFNRLRSADNPQKDKEAEGLIQQSVNAQPSAPYLLVQTVLVQEHALNNAQQQIQQLQKQLQDAQKAAPQEASHEGGVGGFLSGLFGGHSSSSASNQSQTTRPAQPPPMPPQNYAPTGQPPYPTTTNMPASAGGSFLKSALGTAAGVAGGAMLFQGIQNLLGHNAGPFGGFGGGSGFFGGGGGFGGGPDIVENREVINNYYDSDGGNRGNNNNGGNFLGQDTVGFRPHENSQTADNNDSNSFLGEDTVGFQPHQSIAPDDANNFDPGGQVETDNLFAGDNDNSALDNNYDAGNTDASGYDGGSNDDSSYV